MKRGLSGERIAKTPTRELRMTTDGAWVIVIEREKVRNFVGAREWRWEETRISISFEELQRILEKVHRQDA